MKKILTIVAAIFIMAGSASAQGGSFYLGFAGFNPFAVLSSGGGSSILFFMASEGMAPRTGVTYLKDGDKSTLVLGLAPEFGYFISDRFAVGLGAGFNYISNKEEGHDSNNAIVWGVNPYARFYPVKIDRFGLYLQLGLNYLSMKPEGEDAQYMFSVGLTPGISYYVSERVAIHAVFGFLGYSHYGESQDAFGFNLDGTTIMFGLTFGL